MYNIITYLAVFIFGILIGSFLNVCIYRIPKKENIAVGRSHCMNCNTDLKWYELVPVFSFIFLRGKCRTCKSKISIQYPIIEALNGLLYLAVFYIYGWSSTAVILLNIIYCLAISTLIVISVIDFRTYIIPDVLNIYILLWGVLATIIIFIVSGMKIGVLMEHLIGFFSISLLLAIVFYATKGKGIGGGDVKLMAGAGLLLGWKVTIFTFILGCILASVIHLTRMKIRKSGTMLAFGPYLSASIIIGILFGNRIVDWYMATFVYF